MPTHDARILQLRGVDNFRDIGGYPAADGARVKWGRIFRSGHLANLQKFDCQQLRPLHIQSIFDLRAAGERLEFPTRWYGSGSPRIYSLDDAPHETDSADLFDQIMQGKIGRDEVIEHMLDDYANMPFDYALLLKSLFYRLAAPGRGAVLVHCSAGKDRAGLVIALVMMLVGIPFNKIIEDYLLSNKGFAVEEKLASIADRYRETVLDIGERLDALRPLVQVDEAYLMAAFLAIERKYGTMANYFSHEIGLSQNAVQALKQGVLVPNGPM